MSSPRLPLSSRPTFLPDEISRREFATVFRGYDPAEVRTFLNQMAEQSADLSDRVADIQKALAETEERVKNPELTEEMVTSLLGAQTAQILRSAREAAADTRRKTDEEVGRQLRDADEVTSRMKEEAENLLRERTAEAEQLSKTMRAEADEYADETRTSASEDAKSIRKGLSEEVERRTSQLDEEILRRREKAEREINEERIRARQEARDLIDTARMEAQSLVDRTQARQTELIEGLVRRRKIALAQLDSLRAGRQRLLGAYKMVRSTLDEVTAELEKVEEESRQSAVAAGQRAAEAAELENEELDQEIELQQFDLEDDVPENVINLVDSQAPVVPSWAQDQGDSEATNSPNSIDISANRSDDGPFDFEASNAGSNDNVVNLSVVDGESNNADEHDTSSNGAQRTDSPSSPAGTLTRDYVEQQRMTDITVDEEAEADAPPTSATSIIIGESYGDDEDGRALKLRRDAVVSKARSQAVRRLKRALQDEQDSLIARVRTGEFKSIQALLGSPDDQAAAYHRAVVKLLREVVRTGASSVPGSTGVERGIVDKTGTAAARALADQVVDELRQRVIPRLEALLELDEAPAGDVVTQRLSDPYQFLKGDYLDTLVDERVGSVFDEGVALAR